MKDKKPETVEEWFLRNCTRETNEIESELLHHRNRFVMKPTSFVYLG